MQLRLQARYSLFVVGLLAAVAGLIVGAHLLELRAMFTATSRTYGEVMAAALFHQVKEEGEGLGRFLATAVANPIYRLEVDTIQDTARAVRRQQGVVYVAIYDQQGRLLAANPAGAARMGLAQDAPQVEEALISGNVTSVSDGTTLDVVAPVLVGRRLIGHVKLGLSLAEISGDIEDVRATIADVIDERQRQFIAVYIAVAALAVLLGLGVSLLMVRGLVRPIQALSQYTRRIGAGNYDDPPPVERSDELGDLARSLGQMAKDLKRVAQVSRLATLGEMAVGMAHELSQPLNTIRLAAENTLIAMEQGKSDAEFEKAKLSLISHQAESMGELIKRMCVVGRSEGPQDVIDPAESVFDAHSLLVGQLEDEGITVTLGVPTSCAKVLGRRNELAQVVINLLSNARDAILESTMGRKGRLTPMGGRIEIMVEDVPPSPENPSGEVRIKVKDNGGGVPPDLMDRIFDPFFTTKEVTKGTGLGLSISYGIVNAMGGWLTVENFGGGALFTIKLPAIPPFGREPRGD